MITPMGVLGPGAVDARQSLDAFAIGIGFVQPKYQISQLGIAVID